MAVIYAVSANGDLVQIDVGAADVDHATAYAALQAALGVGGGGGGATTLHALTDVNVTEGSGIDGKYLKWDNATSKWIPDTPAGGGGGATTLHALTDVNVTEGSGIDGKYLKWDNATSKWIPDTPASGSSLEVYYAGSSTKTSPAGFTDHVIVNVTDCSITIPGSGVSRVFMVNAGVAWDSTGEAFSHTPSGGGHQMRVCLMLDSAQIWPYPGDTLAGIGSATGGEMMTWASIAGAIITVPGDSASHTLSLAWSPSISLSGFDVFGRGITALKIG